MTKRHPFLLLLAAAWVLGAGRVQASSVTPVPPVIPGTPETPETPATQEREEPKSFAWDQEREFWSFREPAVQVPPRVSEISWPAQPLDYFVLGNLERRDLKPSPEADRGTLIRRVTFDLTGLPPTPEEMDQFVADSRTDAYPQLVERLLASPRFGERLASLWLPLARYAEDQAHQVGDDTTLFYPNAYRYRAWVIDAFNRDLPYDRFVQLQLAADQMEGPTENLAALGFLGLGPKYYNRNRLEVQADEWEDRVDTVTRTVLGLTVACARCHDHKFDPIPTADYYALAGVFASTRMVSKTPDGKVLDGKLSAEKVPNDAMHIVEDGEVRDLNVFFRGRVTRPGPKAERRFLQVLSEGEPALFRAGSGRRELAEQLTRRDNPLTARVWVNRVWDLFFGQPLVPTPSNFGHSGMRPTHPALLDDLAVRFMDRGWSVRALVREIVLSATYRQQSKVRTSGATRDAANEHFWRMNTRRLSIEQWRDAALFVAGDLVWEGGKSGAPDDPANHRRTVYSRISRLELNDLLMQFDYPDANVHSERRGVTTTATQKLFLLNSPFILRQATHLAARLTAECPHDDLARIQFAYRLLYSREPKPEELTLAQKFLRGPAPPALSRWEQYAQALLASNEFLYVD